MTRLVLILAAAALGFAQAPASAPKPALAAPPAGRAGYGLPGGGLMYANIELTVYVVSGLAQPQAGASAAELPDDLASTMNSMRGVFSYKSYKLINAFTLRGRNGGGAEMAGDLPMNMWTYDFKYGTANVYENTPGVVHINRLRLEISKKISGISMVRPNNTPNPVSQLNSGMVALVSTDLDVKEGQKTVVGQSAVNGTDALFLVIVPKVLE
jgi:hypothetical protein